MSGPHALHIEQRLAALGHVETAISETRKLIEVAPGAGPLLINAYK